MTNINREQIEAPGTKLDRVGFLGSPVFKEVEGTMRTLPKHREKVAYGIVVIAEGIKAGKMLEVIVGAERTANAVATGVVQRIERGIAKQLNGLREDMHEAAKLRAQQLKSQQ